MKEALWLELTCRDGRNWRVPVKLILRLAESNGYFIDKYEHERIKDYARKLEWKDVSMSAVAHSNPIPVNYDEEWKERQYVIVEDLNSMEKEDIIKSEVLLVEDNNEMDKVLPTGDKATPKKSKKKTKKTSTTKRTK